MNTCSIHEQDFGFTWFDRILHISLGDGVFFPLVLFLAVTPRAKDPKSSHPEATSQPCQCGRTKMKTKLIEVEGKNPDGTTETIWTSQMIDILAD